MTLHNFLVSTWSGAFKNSEFEHVENVGMVASDFGVFHIIEFGIQYS